MTVTQKGIVVDADGHVLEPADTWIKYIEPQYRDRAVRIVIDDNGYENLLFDNKPLELVRGHRDGSSPASSEWQDDLHGRLSAG